MLRSGLRLGLAAVVIAAGIVATQPAAEPAAATGGCVSTVTTWAQLSAAFTAGSNVCLGADIVGSGVSLSPGSANTNIIDLSGYNLSISAPDGKAAINVPPGASLTIGDSVGTSDVALNGGYASVSGSYLRGAGAAIGGNGGDDPSGQGSSGQGCGSVTIAGGRVSITGGGAADPADGWAAAAAGIGGGGGTDYGANAGGGCAVAILGGRINAEGGGVPRQSNQSFGSAASIGTGGQIGGNVSASAGTLSITGTGTAVAAGAGYLGSNGLGAGGIAPTAQQIAGATGTNFVMYGTDSAGSSQGGVTNIQYTYTVTFVTGGGTAVSAQTPYWGDPAYYSASTKAGYAFDGWRTGSATGPVFNFSTRFITEPTTLYAAWLAPAAVGACTGFAAPNYSTINTLFAQGLTVCVTADLNQTLFIASGLSQLAVPSGVSTTLDLNGHTIIFTAAQRYAGIAVPVTAALTIQDSVGGGQLSVTGGSGTMSLGPGAGIGGNGGSVAAGTAAGTVTINSGLVQATGGSNIGAGAAAPGIGGGAAGYDGMTTLAGGAGGTVNINGGNVTASGGMATYQSAPSIGSGGCMSCTVPSGGAVIIDGVSSAPTSIGNGFTTGINKGGTGAQWSIGSNPTGVTRTSSAAAAQSATFAGSFHIGYSYRVSYNSGGGSSVADEWVAWAGTATQPSTPTKANFTFGSWNVGSTSGAAYTWGRVTAPVALYASWTANPVAVSFSGNGSTAGTAPSTINTSFGASNYTMPNAGSLEKNAFQFTGWNDQANGQGASAAAGSSQAPTASMTWHAQWAQALNLTATVGSTPTAGAPVNLAYTGLQNASAWTFTVQSTPQTLGSGNVSGGVVNFSGTLPNNLGVGFHTLTFSGTASGGGSLTQYLWFVTDRNGIIIAMTTDPTQVATLQALGAAELAASQGSGGSSGGSSSGGSSTTSSTASSLASAGVATTRPLAALLLLALGASAVLLRRRGVRQP